ncbi:hypothetical protein JTE90_028330 [Oedothorax gibbosus]|uniref:Uncharacterized protein n=1 Tax=Oedothorax gibbosus TaxID=931172 RepID=A0AAV6V558_9ARAC|nr:hypothetical protein JTE90_028330 [Oedothorax gibbosus]
MFYLNYFSKNEETKFPLLDPAVESQSKLPALPSGPSERNKKRYGWSEKIYYTKTFLQKSAAEEKSVDHFRPFLYFFLYRHLR